MAGDVMQQHQREKGSTLPRLHDTIQIAMGWTDSHLHRFIIGNVEYGVPVPDFDDEMLSEQRVKLERVITAEKERFVYEYDFGDGWIHDILLEKIMPSEPDLHYPHCVAGKRACPPEDVGGVWGYAEFLEIMHNSDHPRHEEMLEWWEGEFDPEAVSLDEINQALSRH
jgi:hypothetical protein